MGVVKYIGAVVIVMLLSIDKTYAQSDPTLTGMILMYTNKAEKQLKNQEQVMLMMTTGHIWTKEEVKATTDLHREFNNYLDSFRSIVCYAAQVYGFYHEVTQLTNNMGGLIKQLDAHPSNGLAVALSTKRNKIYRELILNSVEIVNDIRTVCLSKNKMTEKERMELVFSIRPQLQQMNHDLATLTKLVRCTNMGLVWYQIEYGSLPHREGKAGVIEECLDMWRINARNVKPN